MPTILCYLNNALNMTSTFYGWAESSQFQQAISSTLVFVFFSADNIIEVTFFEVKNKRHLACKKLFNAFFSFLFSIFFHVKNSQTFGGFFHEETPCSFRCLFSFLFSPMISAFTFCNIVTICILFHVQCSFDFVWTSAERHFFICWIFLKEKFSLFVQPHYIQLESVSSVLITWLIKCLHSPNLICLD